MHAPRLDQGSRWLWGSPPAGSPALPGPRSRTRWSSARRARRPTTATSSQGKKTASGERFDQDELTAAHPELPLGSEVTVTNPDTGKEVEVEVNDRGPYAKGRDIDLSKAAAEELGITEEGVAAGRDRGHEGPGRGGDRHAQGGAQGRDAS